MIVRTHYEVGQTALSVVCDESYMDAVRDAVFKARETIESKIAEDPFFGITFDPYAPDDRDDPLIIRMCQSSEKAGVGPMAGVAGAVAERAVSAAVDKGCTHIIVENGGDIAMFTDRTSRIGVFAGEEGFSDMALEIGATKHITGICSSSGKVGPSVSFGSSGICTVFSDDVILADCCATAFGNMVRTGDREEMSDAAERICSIDGVRGCMCVCNGSLAVCGEVPELVKGTYGSDRLTGVDY